MKSPECSQLLMKPLEGEGGREREGERGRERERERGRKREGERGREIRRHGGEREGR